MHSPMIKWKYPLLSTMNSAGWTMCLYILSVLVLWNWTENITAPSGAIHIQHASWTRHPPPSELLPVWVTNLFWFPHAFQNKLPQSYMNVADLLWGGMRGNIFACVLIKRRPDGEPLPNTGSSIWWHNAPSRQQLIHVRIVISAISKH